MNILIADDEMSMRYDLKFAVERVAQTDDNVFFLPGTTTAPSSR